MIKAALGGGGMRVAHDAKKGYERAKVAKAAFGSDEVYVESIFLI